MPGSYRKEKKAFEPTMEDLGLRRAPVPEKPAPKASDKEYAFRTEEEWFQEWKTKYEDEDFMSLDPSVGVGGNNLTANERRIMKEKMERKHQFQFFSRLVAEMYGNFANCPIFFSRRIKIHVSLSKI